MTLDKKTVDKIIKYFSKRKEVPKPLRNFAVSGERLASSKNLGI